MIKKKIKFIKICGLTDPDNALQCVNAGANAIGLVFHEKSPRHISDKKAETICRNLSSDVTTTGVFVDKNYNFIMKKVNRLSLKAVQLHGNENPQLINDLRAQNLIVIKGIFSKKQPYFKDAHVYKHASFLLAECGKGILPGGNAETWNWADISTIKGGLPIILAGGLDPYNIQNIINQINISGVDVSSGVETCPGIKDLAKVRQFIQQVKNHQ